MNQAIIFPERERWDAVRLSVIFPVLINGMQIDCVISGDTLSNRYGCRLDSDSLINVFRQHRWDIEEQAESLIKDDYYNRQGEIELV